MKEVIHYENKNTSSMLASGVLAVFVFILSGCVTKQIPSGQTEIAAGDKTTTPQEKIITSEKPFSAPLMRLPAVGGKASPMAIQPPEITIGLSVTNDRQIITADAGLYIVRAQDSLLIHRAASSSEISLIGKNEAEENRGDIYMIEVGSYVTEQEAVSEAEKLKAAVLYLPEVIEDDYSRFFRIRFSSLSRNDTDRLVEYLSDHNYSNVREIPLEKGSIQTATFIRLFNEDGEKIGDTNERLIISPIEPGGFLRLGGEPYRGRFEVFLNSDAKMTIINHVNLEDYLKGVVPAEMSGRVFPKIEALKAQAVAARTYAVKNLGQFSKSGYDLCASPLCQVYKGVSAEQALTNQAVEETEGIVATYNGELINAMYTSTCGGHTEDVENVFPAINAPYMRGVTCYPESTEHGILIKTNKPLIIQGDDGRDMTVKFALLDTIGFYNSSLPIGNSYVTGEAFDLWIQQLSRYLGINRNIATTAKNYITRTQAVFTLFDLLNWNARTEKFLSEMDTIQLQQFEDYNKFDSSRLKEISYLLREEIIIPFPDNTLRLDSRITFGEMVRIFDKIIESYGFVPLKRGLFFGYENGRVIVYKDGEVVEYSAASAPYLIYSSPAGDAAGDRLILHPGDRIEFVLNNEGYIKFLKLEASRKGISNDRFSSLYYWQEVFTSDELENQINRHVKVGQVKDIAILKTGVSGRIVQIRIDGSVGHALLNGLEVRRVLGIKENLFVIEKLYDTSGKTTHYIFAGKGWGHGVGLCQVGSYGMALQGKTYDEILKHYYTGIELKKIVANK